MDGWELKGGKGMGKVKTTNIVEFIRSQKKKYEESGEPRVFNCVVELTREAFASGGDLPTRQQIKDRAGISMTQVGAHLSSLIESGKVGKVCSHTIKARYYPTTPEFSGESDE